MLSSIRKKVRAVQYGFGHALVHDLFEKLGNELGSDGAADGLAQISGVRTHAATTPAEWTGTVQHRFACVPGIPGISAVSLGVLVEGAGLHRARFLKHLERLTGSICDIDSKRLFASLG